MNDVFSQYVNTFNPILIYSVLWYEFILFYHSSEMKITYLRLYVSLTPTPRLLGIFCSDYISRFL